MTLLITMKINFIEYVDLAEITRQVIAVKRLRTEPQYDDWGDFLKKTGSIECACDANSYQLLEQIE